MKLKTLEIFLSNIEKFLCVYKVKSWKVNIEPKSHLTSRREDILSKMGFELKLTQCTGLTRARASGLVWTW
jgi:hypothetical protein